MILLALLYMTVPAAAEPDKTILFSGRATMPFTTWDKWDKAVGFGNNEFDIGAFNKPFMSSAMICTASSTCTTTWAATAD